MGTIQDLKDLANAALKIPALKGRCEVQSKLASAQNGFLELQQQNGMLITENAQLKQRVQSDTDTRARIESMVPQHNAYWPKRLVRGDHAYCPRCANASSPLVMPLARGAGDRSGGDCP